MSQTTVYELFERIQRLPAEDRHLLDDLLVEQEESEWNREAMAARRMARQSGIDQAAIDRAVDAVRRPE